MTSRQRLVSMLCALAITLVVLPAGVHGQGATPAAGNLPDGVTVVASGLTNPRGFTWGADGTLFLALAGTGGPNQVIAEDGTEYPYFNGMTSSVVRIDDGCAVPVAEGIASFLWIDPGWIWGAMDLAILDGQLYALLSGGGADVGLPDNPNGVYRVNADGTIDLVADLSAFFRENPPADIPWDYGADGSLFDLEAGAGQLWVSEAVGGRLLTVTPDGETTLVADLSEAHMVPTGIAVAPQGGAYVNHETVVPFPDGAATVIHVAADGTVTDQWTGLTAGTDLTMGPDGALYAAEMATNNLEEPPYLQPGTGRVVRQTGPDSSEPVVTNVDYPVYLGFGPDGALYLTYPAFGPDAGEGQGAILRVDPSASPVSLADIGELAPSCAEEPASEMETEETAAATPDDAAAPGEAAATPESAGATGDAVSIVDFAYLPAELAVAAGTTVTWTNDDWPPHTVTATDGDFDSGAIEPGGTFSYTFDEPGEYSYFCAYHFLMAGTVTVS
jgi:plastocyanin